ncbi:MAG TPA: CoA pyrophosphatase [Candidatus Limnocylindrales bacterium]|nr:CoA pyrophosphatase [Candidatus Limnocylindrales bacterium]
MKYADAVARLATLPEALPDPPASLMPVRVAGEPWRAPAEGIAGARPAAVLILVAPDEAGDARVVLIERATYDGHHSGEMSFPGGAAEAGDPDLVATALREASEEIGLVPEEVGLRVIGQLEPFWIPVSNFRVTPVIAVADRLPPWQADPREVKTVVNAPVAAFLPGAPIQIIERDVRKWRIRYGAYALNELGDGPAVWGATARFLGQLGALLGGPEAAVETELAPPPA